MVNRELEQQRQRQQRERQKCNRSRLAKQQLCTSITLFCTFLSLRRTTTTWEYPIWRFIAGRNIRQQLSFSFPELWYSSLEFKGKKKNANIWRIKRDGISAIKFEAARTIFFQWRFRRYRRHCCLSTLIRTLRSNDAYGNENVKQKLV